MPNTEVPAVNSDNGSIEISAAINELRTLRDMLRWAVSHFNEHEVVLGHGNDDPWDEALALILHALHLPWDADPRILDARLTTFEREKVAGIIGRRIEERIPSAYLTGTAWFAGMPFSVDQRVLVPRSPIGELIEKQFSPWVKPEKVQDILDLCTGSGCIGIACANYFPDALVDCVDLSEGALDVTETNVTQHGLEGQVNVIYSDLFEALEGRTYDIIVSNPPYVNSEDMNILPDEYHHEPRMGLDDGLQVVRRMLPEIGRHLKADGVCIIEVGNSWLALEESYPDVPFTWVDFERGGHGVFVLTKQQIDLYQGSLVL